jgi:hypothetical protein
MPPPQVAELPRKVTLVTFGLLEFMFSIPPPLMAAELLLKVTFVTTGLLLL